MILYCELDNDKWVTMLFMNEMDWLQFLAKEIYVHCVHCAIGSIICRFYIILGSKQYYSVYFFLVVWSLFGSSSFLFIRSSGFGLQYQLVLSLKQIYWKFESNLIHLGKNKRLIFSAVFRVICANFCCPLLILFLQNV